MKRICEKCGSEISVQNYSRHIQRCDGSGIRVYIKQQEPESLNCPYCNRLCKNLNSYRQHTCRCKDNPERKAYSNFSDFIAKERKGRNASNCECIARQVESLKRKYAEGYINPNKGKKIIFDYIYKDHNQEELNKWLAWVKEQNITFGYLPVDHYLEGYELVKINFDGKTKYITQQENVIRQLLKNNLPEKFTIHHINRIRTDNSINNLAVFESSDDHKRYHNSKYAYLTYNEQNHMFRCVLKKIK